MGMDAVITYMCSHWGTKAGCTHLLHNQTADSSSKVNTSTPTSMALDGKWRADGRSWTMDGRTDLVYVHCAGMSAAATCLVQVQVYSDRQWAVEEASPQTFTWPGALADASLLIPADVNGDGKSIRFASYPRCRGWQHYARTSTHCRGRF